MVTLRSLWLSKTPISFQVEWMGARTELPVSPRPCGAGSSAVRIYRRMSRDHFLMWSTAYSCRASWLDPAAERDITPRTRYNVHASRTGTE